MNQLDLTKTKNVHTSQDAWLQGPLWEGSVGGAGPGLAASALHSVYLLLGSVVCWCAHRRGSPLESGEGPTHYTHFVFSLD